MPDPNDLTLARAHAPLRFLRTEDGDIIDVAAAIRAAGGGGSGGAPVLAPTLDALAQLAPSSNSLPYFTEPGTAALTNLMEPGRALLAAPSQAAARVAVGAASAADLDGGGSGNVAEPLDTGGYTNYDAAKFAATDPAVPPGAPGPVVRYASPGGSISAPIPLSHLVRRNPAQITRLSASAKNVFAVSAWVYNAGAAGSIGLRFHGSTVEGANIDQVTHGATAARGAWTFIEGRHVVAEGVDSATFGLHLNDVPMGAQVFVSQIKIRQIVGFEAAAVIARAVAPAASVAAAPQVVGQWAQAGGTVHVATGTASASDWRALAFALRSYTVSTLPSPSPAMQTAYVSNGAGNRRFAISDGAAWRWPDGTVVA